MRKITTLFLLILIIFTLTACGNSSDTATDAQATDTQETQDADPSAGGEKILVAYFSRADENYGVGYIEKGNTRIIAEMIAAETGGTLFEIKRTTPYPESYQECTDEAKAEQAAKARPELTATVDHFADYDTVFLGYPNWWGDMPMPVYTFLESYDFSGKTVIPFCTHGGSGLANTESSIQAECPNATLLKGFAIEGATAQNEQDTAKKAVVDWLNETEPNL